MLYYKKCVQHYFLFCKNVQLPLTFYLKYCNFEGYFSNEIRYF